MAKKTRTNIADLPVPEKELTSGEMEKLKGGFEPQENPRIDNTNVEPHLSIGVTQTMNGSDRDSKQDPGKHPDKY